MAVLTLHSLHWSSWWWVPTNCKLKCDIGLSQNEGYPIPHLTDKACGYWVFQMFRLPNYFQHSQAKITSLTSLDGLKKRISIQVRAFGPSSGVIRGQIGINTFVCLQPLGGGVGAGWHFQSAWSTGKNELAWTMNGCAWESRVCSDIATWMFHVPYQIYIIWDYVNIYILYCYIYIYIQLYIYIYNYIYIHIYIYVHTYCIYVYIIKCMFVNSDEPNKPVPLR